MLIRFDPPPGMGPEKSLQALRWTWRLVHSRLRAGAWTPADRRRVRGAEAILEAIGKGHWEE